MRKMKVRAEKKTATKSQLLKRMTHRDVPATVGLVLAVRDELLVETKSIRHGLDELNHKIDSVDVKLTGKIDSLGYDMSAMESRLEGKILALDSRLHGMSILMEEQRSENRVVLDGIKTMIERQDRVEEETREARETLRVFIRANREKEARA